MSADIKCEPRRAFGILYSYFIASGPTSYTFVNSESSSHISTQYELHYVLPARNASSFRPPIITRSTDESQDSQITIGVLLPLSSVDLCIARRRSFMTHTHTHPVPSTYPPISSAYACWPPIQLRASSRLPSFFRHLHRLSFLSSLSHPLIRCHMLNTQ